MRILSAFIILILSQCLFAGQSSGPMVPTDLTIFTLPGGSYVGEDRYDTILNFADEDCSMPMRDSSLFLQQLKMKLKIKEMVIGKFNPSAHTRRIVVAYDGDMIYDDKGVLKKGFFVFECQEPIEKDKISKTIDSNASSDLEASSQIAAVSNYNNSMSLVSRDSNYGYEKQILLGKPAAL